MASRRTETFAGFWAAEAARDRWIGSSVCCRISEGADIRRIETEALEALRDWVSLELSRRDFDLNLEREPF